MSSQVKRGGKVWKAVVGVISTVIIVGLFVALLVLTASGRWVDSVSSDSASVSHAVSQRRITAYCPSRMTLPDASAYGDSEYQPSEATSRLRPDSPRSERCTGLSSARLAAPAIPRSSRTSTYGYRESHRSLGRRRPYVAAVRHAAVGIGSGVGASASVASWATKGDLRGLSATFCDVGALEQSFVLPDTQTGTTSRWIVPFAFEALCGMFGCGVRNSPVRWRCPREAR